MASRTEITGQAAFAARSNGHELGAWKTTMTERTNACTACQSGIRVTSHGATGAALTTACDAIHGENRS